MIDCRKVLEALYDYIDQEAEGELSAEIQEHIDLCRACFDCCEFEKLLRQHIKDKTHHPCPDKVKIRIRALIEKFEVK